jgi:dTDP-4-amino-4,6-dideoxygalactose transaminase
MIPFNKPFLTGKETQYIEEAVKSGKISGNGIFTQRCHSFLEKKYGFKKVLLTTSCTDALEMCAILADIQPGDEVIVPSFTFVSTALPFVRQGAKVIFADSYADNPNLDATKVEALITPKTKAIVPVHYAGIACDMDALMELARKYNLLIIEDAAQAIDNFYKQKPLGSIGHLAAFSFHETKNIISGEGGMLVINDDRFVGRSEIIWEKGTNRAAFWRGEINKYGWVDVGSSFLPSEIIAAFLLAQLENLDRIQDKRRQLWHEYHRQFMILQDEQRVSLPHLPSYSTNNYHMFYLLTNDLEERTNLIQHMKMNGVNAIFHYQSLHNSPYYHTRYEGPSLPNSDRFSDALIRLPLFFELTPEEIEHVIKTVFSFYHTR